MSPTCAACGRPTPTMPARFLRRDYPKFLDFVADVGTALDEIWRYEARHAD